MYSNLPKNLSINNLQTLTWENYGSKIFYTSKKFSLTLSDKQILKVLLYHNRPPIEYRRKLWMSSSGALREMYNNPNYYHNLLSLSQNLPNPSENQIKLDLKRTFPDIPKCLEQSFLTQLRNILTTYTVRNSSIGYCQGMNFIVGKLLLVIEDEEKAFWLFTQIMEYLLPLDYFADLAGVITDSSLMSILMLKYLPQLYKFFMTNKFELTVNNFIHKWLVGLFTQNFNHDLSDIILDFFFLEGNITLIKTCLGVLCIMQQQLMKLNDLEEIYETLNERTNDIKDPRLIIHFLCVRKFEFNTKTLNLFRESLKEPIIENLRSEKIKRKSARSELELRRGFRPLAQMKKIRCDVHWPFCIFDDMMEEVKEFIIFKCQKNYLIDDYYYCKENGYPRKQSDDIDEVIVGNSKDFLCERKKHYCDDRRLVESSIAMLDEDKKRSSEFIKESNSNSKKEEVDLYEIAMQGKEFQKAKNMILKNFTPAPILQNELSKYYK